LDFSPLLGLLLLALAAAVRWWFLLPFPMVVVGCVYVVFGMFFCAINLALLVGCALELFHFILLKEGRFRESNPGPPAPKAGIMPLDQTDHCFYY
jgi:hypothetical protein